MEAIQNLRSKFNLPGTPPPPPRAGMNSNSPKNDGQNDEPPPLPLQNNDSDTPRKILERNLSKLSNRLEAMMPQFDFVKRKTSSADAADLSNEDASSLRSLTVGDDNNSSNHNYNNDNIDLDDELMLHPRFSDSSASSFGSNDNTATNTVAAFDGDPKERIAWWMGKMRERYQTHVKEKRGTRSRFGAICVEEEKLVALYWVAVKVRWERTKRSEATLK